MLADPKLDAVVLATPVFTHSLARRAALAGRQARVRREAAGRLLSAEADELVALADMRRARADVRAHLPLQPAGPRGQGDARRGRARRALFHLLEPRQPRPVPQRRQRGLRPRPARLLDPALLARGDADAVSAVGRD